MSKLRIWMLATMAIGVFTPLMAQKKIVYLALDTSESMAGLWGDSTKWKACENSLKELGKLAPRDLILGVVTFGGEPGCEAVKTSITAKNHNRSRIRMGLRGESPAGKAPLHLALQKMADAMPVGTEAADWVILTDGGPFCEADMNAVTAEIKDSMPGLRISIVGLNLNEKRMATLASLAKQTKGMCINTANESQLTNALLMLSESLADTKATGSRGQGTLTVAKKASLGQMLDITWGGDVKPGDVVAIFAKKASQNVYLFDWAEVPEGGVMSLRAPDVAGSYEVRYLTGFQGAVLAKQKLKVKKSGAKISAANELKAGDELTIQVQGPKAPGDRLAVYQLNSDEEKALVRIADFSQSPMTLVMPTKSGSFELRYETGMTGQVLARHQIKLSAPDVSIGCPRQVGAGSLLTVRYEGPAADGDTLAIVGMGRGGKKYRFRRVLATEGNLEILAPDKPGAYQVQYISGANGDVLKSQPFQATPVNGTVKGPEKLKVGSDLEVLWTGPGGPGDIIGVYGNNDQGKLTLVSFTNDVSKSPARLLAPDFPGTYRIRYVTGQSKRILAETRLRITDVKAEVSTKKRVNGGKEFEVNFSGPKNRLDVIALFDYENPERPERVNYKPVGHTQSVFLKAPLKPGLYQVRYLLGKSQRTLAKTWVRVRKPN